MDFSIERLSDSAFALRWFNLSTQALLTIKQRWTDQMLEGDLTGIVDVVPGSQSVTVSFDPIALDADRLARRMRAIAERVRAIPPLLGRLIEVPVCYDSPYSMDLDDLARSLHMTPFRLIELHGSVEYTVQMIGFSPGFPYLTGLPSELHSARRSTPRVSVPVGSVGIGGNQTGIYTLPTPGGWHIIGRSPMAMFLPKSQPPCRLQPGDRVRFFPISSSQFENWTEEL